MADEQKKQGRRIEVNPLSTGGAASTEGSERMKKWSQLVAQAWADEKLKKRLLAEPAAVLKEHQIEVPEGVEIRVVENTDKVYYLTLPAKPAGEVTELTGREMKAVMGGDTPCNYPQTPPPPQTQRLTTKSQGFCN